MLEGALVEERHVGSAHEPSEHGRMSRDERERFVCPETLANALYAP